MKKKYNFSIKIGQGGSAILFVVLIAVIAYGIDWLCTCGVIKLITVCFGLTFKWSIATGIWLLLYILRSIFKVTVRSK